jgi:hypothetical protein
MDYEERMIDGTLMVAYNGCWYPTYEDEPDYDAFEVDYEEMNNLDFPFADLSDDEMNALYNDLTDARIPVPYYECDDDDDMDWVNY